MTMIFKIKAAIVAGCILLILLSVSIFAHSRLENHKKEMETQTLTTSLDETLDATANAVGTEEPIEDSASELLTEPENAPETEEGKGEEPENQEQDDQEQDGQESDDQGLEENVEEQEPIEESSMEPEHVQVVFTSESTTSGPNLSIVSYDTETKIFKDLTDHSIDASGTDHLKPKLSSSGKLLAFIKRDDGDYSITSGIYVMRLDEPEAHPKKVVNCSKSHSYDFGPGDESILYLDRYGNLKQIDISGDPGSVKEIANRMHGSIGKVSQVGGYVYWGTDSAGGFEIRRKNLLAQAAESQLVFKSVSESYRYFLDGYLVSPDGKQLLVSEKAISGRILRVFNIENGAVTSTKDDYDEFINENPSGCSFSLEEMTWHRDSHGQDWIYAKKVNDPMGLARVKFADLVAKNYTCEVLFPINKYFWDVSVIPKPENKI